MSALIQITFKDHNFVYFEVTKALSSILPKMKRLLGENYCNIFETDPATPGLAANTKYNYGLEGTVAVYLTGSSDNKEAKVKLVGQVSVTALGNCGHELAVQSLVISGPDGKKYQSPPGIEKPIRFSLQDGRLSSEICASEGDTRRSLNIKRAIISLLQTEQKSTTQNVYWICWYGTYLIDWMWYGILETSLISQVDIFGACPTEIAYSSEGGATLIHRTRDLARCAHREQGKNDLIASVLNENAEIKESQVLQSTLHVESKVNNGVPEKVSASEEYLYKPFSVGENGARAKVNTRLTLTGKSGGSNGASHCTVPRTVIFEAPHGAPLKNNVQSALNAVKETAKAIGNEASEKRVYLDALLRTGTGPSIDASIKILKSHGLNELEQQLVYLSLGNAKHVNDEALKAATGLLDQHDLPKETYLGVSALAGAYCRSHQCHTTKSDGIVALSQKLGAKLQNCKPKTKVEEDNVVAVLKGIRSIRHLEDSLIDKLVHCANDHNLKKAALDIMKNRQLDSEIRIKAYLAVIACPCGKSANEIKTLLDSEPVHQVGRYITSSLRAIRSSSNPDKRLAKQHYGLVSTPNKFNVDDRKYSFYRESSFNIDALGVGGAVEQSVIYSQNSFLPRSASLNLTTEIFGHSFNGLLNTKGPQAIYDILFKAFSESSDKVKEALNRGRRSVKTEIEGFDKNLKAEELHFDNELDLDLYVKLFGTDAIFLSLGDDKGFDYSKVLDKLMNAITGGIGKAQHLSTELRTHLLFLDAELSYPTSAGLPLRLELTGAATARLDLSTNFDLKQCITNPQFIPSTDIEISGTLIVDADEVATGLKVVTNLHSSTGVHLIAKVLENGNGLDLQLGLPVEKQEILVASNDLVYITVEKGQKEKHTKIVVDGERKEYSGCFDQLSGLLGMTLCGEVSLPFSVSGAEAQASISKYLARYPLSGQSKLKLVLEKNDLKGYHVGFNVGGNDQRTTFKPIFEYQIAGEEKHSVQIDGQVTREINGPVTKYSLDGISIRLPKQEPISVQGFFSNQANARNTEWELVSDMLTVKGSLKNSDLEMEFFNKLNPAINFKLKGHSEFADVIKNEFDIVYSGDCKDKSRRVIFLQYLKYQAQNEHNYNVITKNKLEIVSVPFKIQFDADIDPKKVEVEFQFKNVDQKADFELKARTQMKKPEDFSVKITTNLNKNGLEIFSKRDVINNDKSNLENYVVVKGIGKYELSGVVFHKTQPNDIKALDACFNLFDVEAIQTPVLYSSHAKISNNQGEILDYLFEVKSGANANGKLKFVLKDSIAANGQFQVTDADGKGNGGLIIDFKKSQRKIKADVKFQAKKPVFNGDFDIFLNWEKDNNDKICFSTNTKQTEKVLDSKNKLEYGGKTTEVNVNLNGELAVTGKSHANIEVYNGNVNLLLSDAPKRGAGASTITYKGKIINTDLEKQILDYQGQIDFKLKGGKQLQNTFTLKNQAQGGDKFKFDFKTEVTGNVVPKPSSLMASLTYLDSLTVVDETYRVKAAHGDDLSVDLTGKWEVNLENKGDKKYLDDFTVAVRLPFEKAHDIKWVSTILYLLPENKDESEYSVIQSVQVNADVWKIDANGKIGRLAGSGTVKYTLGILKHMFYTGDRKALYTEVKAKYGKGKSASISVDTSGTASGNSLCIKASTPQLEKMKKLEITVNSKHPAPDTYASTWVIDADGRVYKSESSIVLSKAHPILDLTYTSPTNGKTSRIYVKGSSLSSTQGKVEIKIDNVRDISLDATSEANVQKDNVNFKVQANSKELGWKNFVGEIVSKDAGNGKRLEFHSTNDNKNVLSGSTSFISKQEGSKTIIEGSGSVKVKDEQKSANFKYIRTILNDGSEKGVETFFNVAFGERSYVAESRVTNLEYKNSHVYCEEKQQCAHAELQSKIDISNSKSGIKIQLPSREMVLEHSVSYPTDKPLPFPIRGELVLDLDAKHSGHKAAARFLVDLNVNSDDKQTAVAEFGFSHPKIGKEALVRISGAAIRRTENSFKIETTAKVSLACLGKDREAKILFEASPTHLNFLINTPLVKVIDISASAAIKDKLQKADLKFVLLEGKPVQVEFLVKDFQHYEFTTAEADRKLSVVGHIEPEKRVDISADIILGGQKKNLAHGALWLDNNLVKSDYGASQDHCNYFYDLDDLETRVKQLGQKASNDFKDVTRRVQPTLQKLETAYKEDLQKIYKEIADDKLIDEVVTATKPIVDNISNLIIDLTKKIQDVYEKEIEPAVQKFYNIIATGLKSVLDSAISVVSYAAAFVTDFFEKHKVELQELTNTIAEIFKDLTRLIVAQLKEYRVKVTEIFTEFTQWLQDLPILQAIKAKKLRKDKCDDAKELKVVYQKLVTAVASLIQLVRNQLNQYGVVPAGPQVTSWWNWSPMNVGSAPALGGSTSFSALKQILTGDFPDISAIINAYRPRSLNPLEEVPSKLRAVIVNGQHIFTFDGRHLTFPGNCRYVLAHDYVDRNFTLLLQMAAGKPKALVLEDKNGVVIELKDNGQSLCTCDPQATLNGANHGFPVEEKDSFAFRQANGRVGLGTLYGLMAFCTAKLEVCYIEVNGFYLGKLRGLLGDGNNEPFDDFRLPSGKICTSESEFGNAYRLAKSCPQVQVPEHSHHQLHHAPLPEACEKVFGGISPLKALSLVLDIAPFRQACIHAVAGDSANALSEACNLGKGYAALAVSGLLPVVMPDVCLQCTDADKPKKIGDSYEFKLPNKQADIVIAVETTKVNEKTFKELVVPLVSQVIDQLKGKHCGDVKVYLAGITSKFPYPVMYDTDLKLKNAKITFTDESRYNLIKPITTGQEKVDSVLAQFVQILNGLQTSLGFSKNSVLMLGDKKPGKDNQALKSTLTRKTDSCIDFFEDVDGLVFSSANYQALAPAQQKQFIQTASGAISHSMLHENLVQECTCVLADANRRP
ncbi:Apolipophorin protein [Operophtera brumata]|uniref:Apolipophorin protein n=1 Tax=Operophtera brumata TaxID=104452 RepID=A0A0L7LKM3_OPEBR|nr:Apolipophorin protein [Operophtera brumata]